MDLEVAIHYAVTVNSKPKNSIKISISSRRQMKHKSSVVWQTVKVFGFENLFWQTTKKLTLQLTFFSTFHSSNYNN